MLIKTRYFGEIDVDDQKVIIFENGLIGFEYLKRFTLIYNNESETSGTVTWLQSLDEPMVAFPALSPFYVMTDYNPVVEDEVLAKLGELTEENTAIFLTLTVPSDITKMTTNLKAPIIINADTKKGCQVIAENPDYVVKYNIYDVIQKMKERKGCKPMLALSRKANESIVIGHDVEITILEVKGDQVKLGINAPKSVPIYRKEIYVQIQEANKEAVAGGASIEDLKKVF